MRIYLCVLLIVAFSACSINNAERQASVENNQTVNNEVIGKKIIFSNALYSINNSYHVRPNSSRLIILTTVSTDCAGCIEKFMSWNNFDTQKLVNFDIIFVAMGPKTPLIEHYLKEDDKKKFTILIDTAGTFLRENNLYNYDKHTMVLGKNKSVIYVGDPIKDKNALLDFNYLAK